MGNQNLLFKSLSVYNARGIRRGRGFACEDLGQVNVIYGSNGIGKSTAGLALMALLSPAEAKLGGNCDVAGVIEVDQQSMDLAVRGKDGTACSADKAINYPRFTSADQLTRYRLALEELIQSDDVEFAAIIAKETRGGFDLEQIVSRRKYRLRPSTPNAIQIKLEQQRIHCAELRRKQEALVSWEATLADLKEEKQSLVDARDEIPIIEAVRRNREHQSELNNTLDFLSAYPDAMDLLSGDDSEFILQKTELRDSINAEVEDLEKSIGDLEQEVEAGGKQELVEQSVIDRLKLDYEEYRALVAKHADLNNSIMAMTSEADACLEVFIDDVSEDVARQFDGLGWTQIENLWAQEIQYRDQRNAAQRLVEVFQQDCGTSELQALLLELKQDVESLQDWLRSPSSDGLIVGKQQASIALTAIMGMAVLTVILSITAQHVGWLGLISIPLGLGAWLIKSRFTEDMADHRKVIQTRLESRVPIEIWDKNHVEIAVEEKHKEQGEIAAQISKSQYSDAATLQLENVTRQHQESVHAIQKWATSLDLTWDAIGPFHFVNVFRAINRRNELVSSLQGLDAQRCRMDTELEESLQAIKAVLKTWGHPVDDNANNLLADILEFGQGMQRRRDNISELAHLRAQVDTKRGIAQQCNDDINGVCAKLGVEAGAFDDILALEEQLESYNELVRERIRRETLISAESSKVKSISGSLHWSEIELQEKLDYATQAEFKLNDLQDLIASNMGKISAAGESSELFQALTKADEIQQKLIDDREAAFHGIIGRTLVDWLAEESTSDRTSDVFVEASLMLDKITQGQLTLGVSQSGQEEFFVIAPGNERRELDQLSVGERVQVLLSIRMAFLSHSELAVLPLVLDETLGTSDDERAHDIINSVLELASLGRQVFYFTAQMDEVAKWKFLMDKYPALDSRFIDLDVQLDNAIVKEIPPADAFSLATTIDMPQDCSHQEFGEHLGVRRPILFPYNPSDLHLWYFIEDIELLYACVQVRVMTWGSLQQVVKHNVANLTFISQKQFATLQARAVAVTTAVAQWSVGRAAPITRVDLQRSGVVTNTFLERIWEVATSVECCGASLIIELRGDSRPKQWSEAKTDKLEEYLHQVRKIDTVDRRTPDEIYSQAAIALESHGERLANNDVWLRWILENILRA